jgi:hypothetical protein
MADAPTKKQINGGNGSAAEDDLNIPAYLSRAYREEAQERGESPKLVTCRVWIKEIRPPALGPPGDSLDDLVR